MNPSSLANKLRLFLHKPEPLIEIRISRQRLLGNLQAFQKTCPGLRLAPVLKSNAYGHGLELMAKVLGNVASPFWCVDSLYEARRLRSRGCAARLLVLGYVPAEAIAKSGMGNWALTVTSLDQLRQLSELKRKSPPLHLKLDTGMRRQGLMPDQLNEALGIISKRGLIVEGLCSHLAAAESPENSLTKLQISRWNEAVSTAENKIGKIRFLHLANTAGCAFNSQIRANVARLGLGLYGYRTGNFPTAEINPALEMHSVISSLRRVKAGEQVGYGGFFKASGDLVAATVPVGYAEGLDRRLSSSGSLTVQGKPCALLGRISMNICSIDVSGVKTAALGEPVCVISSRPQDPNSIETMAALCQTIPYELLVHLPAHLRRRLID